MYKSTSTKIREVKGKLRTKELLEVFDKLIKYLKETVSFIDKYASKGVALKAKKLLNVVIEVRNSANKELGKFLKPVQNFLEKLAVRIDKEGDAAFKATTNVKNVTRLRRVSDAEELEAFRKNRPNWVHVLPKIKSYLSLKLKLTQKPQKLLYTQA